ncbi:MAG: antitoxin [Pyrobaculum sp.]
MSVVISVRIPRELRDKLRELGIDYHREIVEFLKKRVQEEYYRQMSERYRKLLERGPRLGGDFATEFIREDREAG